MHQPRGSLVFPWALTGAIGGYLFVEAVGLWKEREWGVVAALIALTPIVAGTFGWLLTRHARTESRGFSAPFAFASTLVAGLVNGVVIGMGFGAYEEMPAGLFWGMVGGSICGVLCALPFLAPLTISAAAVATHGRAREGSIVDRSDARLVWMAIPPCAALASLVVEACGRPFTTPTFGVLGVSLASVFASALLLYLDARSLAAARAQMRVPDDGAFVDVGVGDRTIVRVAPALTAYRDVDRDVHVHRGDPALASKQLGVRTGVAFASFILCAGSLALAFAAHHEPEPQPWASAVPAPAMRSLYVHENGGDPVELLGIHDTTAFVRGGDHLQAVDWPAQTTWEPSSMGAIAMNVPGDHAGALSLYAHGTASMAHVDDGRLRVWMEGERPRDVARGVLSVSAVPSSNRFVFTDDNGIYVVDAETLAAPRGIPGLSNPIGAPIVTASDLYVIANGSSRCLHRVEIDRVAIHTIWCPNESPSPLVSDPLHELVVMCDGRHCKAYRTPDGLSLGSVDLQDTFVPKAVSSTGYLIGSAPDGSVAFASLFGNVVHIEPRWGDLQLEGGQWSTPSTFVALRRWPSQWELIEIDVQRMTYSK